MKIIDLFGIILNTSGASGGNNIYVVDFWYGIESFKNELDNSHFLFQIYWFFYIGLQ
jgi:hypothetical protein